MFTFWTRAGTWRIAYSHEPAGDGAASCLIATAYPAVVPVLLWGNELVCGSSKEKNNDIVIAITCFLRVKCPTHYLTKAPAVVGEVRRQRQAHFLSVAPCESHPPAPKWSQ
ncbi:hypothetical protein CSV70_01625 [Sporosarcina sp. P25]|nr:hypothetical protein CSV70_01625 [Sporosarcina sp. P25]